MGYRRNSIQERRRLKLNREWSHPRRYYEYTVLAVFIAVLVYCVFE